MTRAGVSEPDTTRSDARECSCGGRTRPHINHRFTIPCWTYIGTTRHDIDKEGGVVRDHPIVCQECHSSYEGAGGYHPFLYCELIKLGHRNPEAYLREYGFARLGQGASKEPFVV